jgi:predicted transcriptional regulator YdeE
MNYMKSNDSLKIIGISVRTTNKDNQSAQDIGKLWGQFYSENILEKIPNKVNNDIYSIYTDYKNNFQDEYTTIIGVRVNNLHSIPAGCVGREFPNENFKVFTAKGQMPKAIMDAWFNIWQQDKELQRKYTYDFELYSDKSHNGENSEVDIYISTNK